MDREVVREVEEVVGAGGEAVQEEEIPVWLVHVVEDEGEEVFEAVEESLSLIVQD